MTAVRHNDNDMIPGKYNFKPQYAEDTCNGIQVTATLTSGETTAPIDLTNIAIKMVFKKQGESTAVLTFEIGTGITLTDAENGVFTVDAFTVPTTPYTYVYDIEFTYPSTVVKTYMQGLMEVKPQITI